VIFRTTNDFRTKSLKLVTSKANGQRSSFYSFSRYFTRYGKASGLTTYFNDINYRCSNGLAAMLHLFLAITLIKQFNNFKTEALMKLDI